MKNEFELNYIENSRCNSCGSTTDVVELFSNNKKIALCLTCWKGIKSNKIALRAISILTENRK